MRLTLDAVDPHYRYENEANLVRIIYFRRVSDERWRRSDTRSFGWLKRIRVEQTLRSVILATNVWGKLENISSPLNMLSPFSTEVRNCSATTIPPSQPTRSYERLGQPSRGTSVQRELFDEKRGFDRMTVGKEITREGEGNRVVARG